MVVLSFDSEFIFVCSSILEFIYFLKCGVAVCSRFGQVSRPKVDVAVCISPHDLTLVLSIYIGVSF